MAAAASGYLVSSPPSGGTLDRCAEPSRQPRGRLSSEWLMRHKQIGFLLTPMCVLTHSVASAQRPTVDVSTLIQSQQHVRLRLRDGNSIAGQVDPQHPNSASLILRAPTREVPYELIDSVWVRRTAVRKGAIIGGTLLGVAGFVRFAHLCFTGAGCLATGSENTTAAKWRAVSVMTLASAGTGTVLGAIIGVLVPRWELSYARMSP
jgi:hypothetical protein